MYNPLPEYLTIKPSPIHGLGLFATQDIPKDTNLGVSLIKIKGTSNEIIRTPLGGFYNHSEENNVIGLTKERQANYDTRCLVYQILQETSLVTIKDIKAGEEITGKYNMYNPEEKK